MQLHAGVEQHRVRLVELAVVVVQQDAPRRLGPAQRVDVAHSAAPVFEIGLEPEGHFAGLDVTRLDSRGELGEPAAGLVGPLFLSTLGQLRRQELRRRRCAGAQQRGRRVEVVGREAERFTNRAHAVAELQALVPDRIPDAIGDRANVDALVAQQHDVDVARRAQLGSPVPADRRRARPPTREGSPRRATRRATHPRGPCTPHTMRPR